MFDGLPEYCYTINKARRDVVIIVRRGEIGYWLAFDGVYTGQEWADEFNRKLGVTKKQEAAMQAGSIFGFDVPAADPAMYDEEGKPIRHW